MAHILYLTNIDRQYIMMQQTNNALVREGCLPAGDQVLFINDSTSWNTAWQERFANSSLIIFSWMGTGRDTVFLKQAIQYMQANRLPHTFLASEKHPQDSSLRVTEEEYEIMRNYLGYSGIKNYRNFWLWLDRVYRNGKNMPNPPQQLLWNGIFHPSSPEAYTDLAAYLERIDRTKPTVGVLFPRDEWIWNDLTHQSAVIAALEQQGVNVISVFSHWARNVELGASGVDDAVKAYFYCDGQPVIDVLINTIKFSLTVGRPVEPGYLARLGVPVLQAYTLLRPRGDWEASIEGLTPVEVSLTIALPEFDGIIHTLPIAGKETMPDGTAKFIPIIERIERLAAKAKKWALLRKKPNHEKKIAIIFHNYPPGNASIGNAAGLDSPASVRLLLEQMAAAGYTLDHIPPDSQALMQDILTQATNDRRFLSAEQVAAAYGRISGEQYRQWFAGLAQPVQDQLTNDWGQPPGEVMNFDGDLLVPGMLNGNVFITVQPPRGFGEDPAKTYHSPDCAPTHHYLAYYHWIRDVFGADAVVHVGTHGSLEWLPGKGTGLSAQCYPDLAIGDLPNVYPYLITIVGEGMQAKRRGAACMIGHLPPPMGHADTYDEWTELENLLDEYVEIKRNQPANAAVAAELVRQKALELKLAEDVPELPGEDFEEYFGRLHAYLSDIKNMQIRVGLHILGCPPAGDSLNNYLLALTRLENGDFPSLPQTLAAVYGFDYYDLLENSGELLPDGRTRGELVDEIRSRSLEFVELLAEDNFSAAAVDSIPSLDWVKAVAPEQQAALRVIAQAICGTLIRNLALTEQEQTNLLAALAGCYVEPGPSGAPTSGMADILPTGRNFFGVDPRTLPTQAAWEIGKTLGDNVIERYVAEEGRYPENIGMVFWGGANMRSRGQCIAEYFYLLGVRPVWQKGSLRVIGLEVIPVAELQRPRIDVTARISGLFRDALPAVVNWMDKAVKLVAALDEPEDVNYVRKHALADTAHMEAAGTPADQAWEHACLRVFGCPPGAYGAGVAHALEEKNWETVDDLAAIYVRWGAHAYGTKTKGTFVPELFSRRLSSLDVTIKNEDNREVHMLNSDDFNAYHGGMIAAVRSLKGTAPRSYCGDSSDRNHVALRSLGEEFRRIFRGETLNPKYLAGMRNHGYKGAADLASVVAHCYDWDATSEVMENWMYDSLAQKYALDQDMQDWMQEVNPWALQRIAEKLLEAERRGMWQADPTVKTELEQLYLSIEGELEERSDRL